MEQRKSNISIYGWRAFKLLIAVIAFWFVYKKISEQKDSEAYFLQLKEALGDSIRIIKIDVDKQSVPAGQYKIQSVPTLMLFRNGQSLWRQSGALSLAELRNIVNGYL